MLTIPSLEGFAEYHGVRVSYTDGGGDELIALGHHRDAQTVIAAFVAHSIADCGLAGIQDDPDLAVATDRPDLLRQTWAVETNGSLTDWRLQWMWLDDDTRKPITEETPGAFPITAWIG